MVSKYKFLRTVDGISYFARVWVEVDLDSGIVEVVDAIGRNANSNEGEYDAQTASSWVNAALEGASAAAEYLINAGFIQNGCLVRIMRLVGSIVDSREDVISCAAALATWQAACPHWPLPEPFFERGAWKLKYPKIEHEANILLRLSKPDINSEMERSKHTATSGMAEL